MITEMPKYREFHWPTLLALRDLGGSASIDELNSQVMESMNFSDHLQAILHKDGPTSEIEYRLAWARTYLKGMGLAENSMRGVWVITEAGRMAEERDLPRLRAEYLKRLRKPNESVQRVVDPVTDLDRDDEPQPETDWKELLLDQLMAMEPSAFEHLATRLLREQGFINTKVTGKSGDGGIDGLGVYRLSLLSFPVFFQCKRYSGSVTASMVRDFRGAMAGRGDKGLLITTGSFTRDAKNEASRAGTTPIDLIDGNRLCDLLKECRLGVKVEERVVEDIEVDGKFFESFQTPVS